MKSLEVPDSAIESFDVLTKRVQKAMRACGRDVLIRHKREGFPVVSWENGKVVLIPPEQIVIPPPED